MIRSLSSIHFLALALTIAACHAGASPVPQAAPPLIENKQEPPKQPAVITPPPAGGVAAAVDSNGYKVESPDILFIRVWHEQDFTGSYAVHPDGKITMPLIGDLEAGGKTPAEVEKIVKEALAKYVVNPIVTVTVQGVLSKKYYIDGEINRPGEYELVAPTTVFEAISKAGGVGGFANEKKIYVLRGEKRYYFNYKDVLKGKHLDQNIQLQPGDHIVVP